ncbi:hypothetical protein QAD02_007228 [Eretmocerus hayati]|uniref:Uncharacterized protein n=1 Tax=Eretmocerus hayati TaxID=131215 RepID=A0ACC2N3X3_9HYME|nr:hypothetical protein QAD02_007228 [Eretmocerus hayati]
MEESSLSTKGMERSSSKDLTTSAKSRDMRIPHPLKSSLDALIDIMVTGVMEGIVPHLKCPTCEERLTLIRPEKLVPELSDDEDEGIDVVTVDTHVSEGTQTPQSTRKAVKCVSPKGTTIDQVIRCKTRSTRLLEKRAKRAK